MNFLKTSTAMIVFSLLAISIISLTGITYRYTKFVRRYIAITTPTPVNNASGILRLGFLISPPR